METIAQNYGIRIKDLSFCRDHNGDDGFNIERSHIHGWDVDEAVKEATGTHITYFRVIQDGILTGKHGWLENGEIIQWG
jgi:hypothetical protein